MIITKHLMDNYGFDSFSVMATDDNFGFGAVNEDIYKTLGISAEDLEKEILKLTGER